MSKIIITLQDDPNTGGVMYESKCDDMTLHNGEPSAAMIVAHTLLMYITEHYGAENMKPND